MVVNTRKSCCTFTGSYILRLAWKWLVISEVLSLLLTVTLSAASSAIHIKASTKETEHIDSKNIEESLDVELLFLTKVNAARFHQRDYHIVNITIPEKKASYIVHLSKPEDLFHTEDLGLDETQAEELRCLYSGTISSDSGESVGIASLSSCQYENGFEGLLFLENEHYHITPDKHLDSHNLLHRSERSAIKFNHRVKHKISSSKTATETYIRHDTKKPPLKEVEKAREEMLKNQDSLDDETDDEDETDENDNDDKAISSIATSFTDCDSKDPNCKTTNPPVALAARRQIIRRKPGKKSSGRVIELAIFTDYRFWLKWAVMHPKETEKNINQYILALVNHMNYLYNQPSMKEKISFRLVHVGIQKTIPTGLQPTPFAEKYLDSFCEFAGEKNSRGVAWDHAMMLSGYDLLDDKGSPGNIGIAFTSVMCLRTLSCSLIEFRNGFESAFTAAHEIGHSLGMEHDGEAINKKCDASKFLMAAAAEPGQRNWSPCSNQNLANFLKSGDPRPKAKDPDYIPKCLKKRGSKRNQIQYKTGAYPGQKFDIKQQCSLACTGCKPHVTGKPPHNNICFMLYCEGIGKRISEAHPALEGTSCGVGGKKKCRNGACQ